jgi:hypothetical protein
MSSERSVRRENYLKRTREFFPGSEAKTRMVGKRS